MNETPRLLPEHPSIFSLLSGAMRRSLGFKLLLVGGILVAVQIPLAMTYGVRAAREGMLHRVQWEIASKWGGEQTIGPPALSFEAEERWTETRTVQGRTEETPRRETAWQVVLPDELAAAGTVEPEVRSRGLYQAVLHRASVKMKGAFAVPPRVWRHETGPERAFVSVGVPDPKGLKRVRLVVAGEEVPVEPGTAHVWGAGFRAAVDPAKFAPGAVVPFELELIVNGSGDLLFAPAGRNFSLKLDGPWPSPSFTGETLPDARTVGPDGFSAEWNVMELNRPYPQSWRGDEFRAAGAASGLSLVLPANFYQQVDRAMKYASLFVLVVLFAVLAAERLARTAAHPVQYFVAALALVLFGMLLLSLSEHMAFPAAYAVSALVVAGMTGAYAGAVFRRRAAALGLGGLTLGSYALMYAVLRVESIALLLGTLVLVGVLAFLMVLTAKMNR
ncbi:MAG: inner membrane CreD family protein [Kiritimatiellae bacterium]|nr:inner membrane CreD family protein [Kiritimatiellia bacterium]